MIVLRFAIVVLIVVVQSGYAYPSFDWTPRPKPNEPVYEPNPNGGDPIPVYESSSELYKTVKAVPLVIAPPTLTPYGSSQQTPSSTVSPTKKTKTQAPPPPTTYPTHPTPPTAASGPSPTENPKRKAQLQKVMQSLLQSLTYNNAVPGPGAQQINSALMNALLVVETKLTS